ncbi:MAG: GyrI-like domain-containing protein [Enterococcus sp.]
MVQDLNALMDYIEEHLLESLSADFLAKELGMSAYHLKRTFLFIAGMSLNDYLKKRRLACANQELVKGKKVTELAFKYGYKSVEGFSRAFREFSGFLPSEVIKNQQLISFPKLTFFIQVRGGVSMEYKIEQKSAFHLVGVTKRVPVQFEGVNQAIQELAATITPKQREEMHELGDLYPQQVLNASYSFDEGWESESGELTHIIGFATSQENPYADLETVKVASHTWAIFPNTGPFPQTLQATYQQIYTEWLPSANYELVPAPGISFTNYQADMGSVYSEIWVAVKEKQKEHNESAD